MTTSDSEVASWLFRVWYFYVTPCNFVLPESIFGTISALGAGFAAFGLVGYVKLRKQKKPKQ